MPNRDGNPVALTATAPLASTGGAAPVLSLRSGSGLTVNGSGQLVASVNLATDTTGTLPATSLPTTGTAGTTGGAFGSGAASLLSLTTDAYGRLSSTTSNQIWFDLANLIGWDAVIAAGNYTIGYVLIPWCAMSSTGATFWWPTTVTPARTVTCTLWPGSGAALRTGSVSVTTAGLYTVTWATPYAMTAKTLYRLSVWDSSGTSQLVSNLTDYGLPMSSTRYGLIGPNLSVGSPVYAAGNAIPTIAKGAMVALSPTITVP